MSGRRRAATLGVATTIATLAAYALEAVPPGWRPVAALALLVVFWVAGWLSPAPAPSAPDAPIECLRQVRAELRDLRVDVGRAIDFAQGAAIRAGRDYRELGARCDRLDSRVGALEQEVRNGAV